jgi:hypothetical protein
MPSKPKPEKVEKTFENKLAASRWCQRHQCPKTQCHPHRASQAKPRKSILSKKLIRVKPKSERRVFSKSERTLLEARLDTMCSKFVIARDRHRCVTCGTTKNLTCSHFVKRAHQILRYDVDENLNCQCRFCNEAHNTDESAYEAYLTRKIGIYCVSLLRAEATITHFSWSVPELRDMVIEIQARLDRIGE